MTTIAHVNIEDGARKEMWSQGRDDSVESQGVAVAKIQVSFFCNRWELKRLLDDAYLGLCLE